MARIGGVDLPRNKRMEYALPYLYGIGLTRSRQILTELKIDFNMRSDNLTEEDAGRIKNFIDRSYKIEGDARRQVQEDIRRLMNLRCYRGLRHMKNLPVRGQRTKTNARTRKGPRGQAIAKKKKV